jgi:hypothetical protein
MSVISLQVNPVPLLVPVFKDAIETADVVTMLLGATDSTGKYAAPASKFFAANGSKVARQPANFVAVQLHAPTAAAMRDILAAVSKLPSAAICNGRFPGLPVYDLGALIEASNSNPRTLMLACGFRIVSQERLSKLTAEERTGSPVTVRTKATTLPTSWIVVDRDVDELTPKEFAELNVEEWIAMLARFALGLDQAPRIETPSSSARVFRDGKALASGRGHIWIKTTAHDYEVLVRARVALRDQLIADGKAWSRPDKNGRPQVRLPIDFATWTSCTMVYSGKPEVAKDSTLSVVNATFEVVNESGPAFNLAAVPAPSREALIHSHHQLRPGVAVTLSGAGARSQLDVYDLAVQDEVELPNGCLTTVAEVHADLRTRHERGETNVSQRLQSPFRPESRSVAAWAGLSSSGELYICDSGIGGETHWLKRDPASEFDVLGPSAADIIAELRLLDRDKVTATWAAKTAALKPPDVELVIDEVRRLTGLGVRPLRAALKEARDVVDRERRSRQLSESAGQREQVPFDPTRKFEAALQIERLIVERFDPVKYFTFAGRPAEVVERELPYTHAVDDVDAPPPRVSSIAMLDKVAMLGRVEAVAQLVVQGARQQQAIAVPQSTIDVLLNKRESTAPDVTGLATHPTVLSNGDILSETGLHQQSRLILVGDTILGCRPYTRGEAREAGDRLKANFLDGFEFESDLDVIGALAMLITGVQRKVLDSAPGVLVTAKVQSTGKTTLARRVNLILTQRDLPVTAFPGSEEEMQKTALALLLASPAMLCFDNIPDGFTFRSPTLAMLITAPTFKQRLLGVSQDVEVPTNTLLVATGNNPRLGLDENTRWLEVRLEARTARPERRRFRHTDVVAHALDIRDQVLRDAVGIVAGYLRSADDIALATRFPAWDRMVRQPLIWAGVGDVADAFNRNSAVSEEIAAHANLIRVLHSAFGQVSFMARDITQMVKAADLGPSNDALHEILEALRVKDVYSTKAIGWLLNRLNGRRCTIDEMDMWIETSSDGNGRNACRIRGVS